MTPLRIVRDSQSPRQGATDNARRGDYRGALRSTVTSQREHAAMTVHLPRAIRFGRDICGDLDAAERREWWLTNGRGGYCAGTVAGTLTRRYHGLLVAPVIPPLGRRLLVAKADAILSDGTQQIPLCTNRWRSGAVEPRGHVHIESFELDGRLPVWRFAMGDTRLEMRIWMEPHANTSYVAYRLLSTHSPPPAWQLHVKILINGRDHHGNTNRFNFSPTINAHPCDSARETLRVSALLPSDCPYQPTLILKTSGGTVQPVYSWHDDFDLPLERERGLDDCDAHLCIAQATLMLATDAWTGLVMSVENDCSPHFAHALQRARAYEASVLRRANVGAKASGDVRPCLEQLLLAADSFLFTRPISGLTQGESVIAGYPWFGDWGRDTMIALPGLTLASGRPERGARILRTFAGFVDRGMLPNCFPGDGDTAQYNTVDAALWYIEAVRQHWEATNDRALLRELYPTLESIITHYRRGTRYGIRQDERDALLFAGEAGVALTWMDAKVGDWVVTPRIGKAVEINALWTNALHTMARFARALGEDAAHYETQATRADAGFSRFLNPHNGGLFDVIDGPQGNDARIRPNQLFAVSLWHSPLAPAAQRQVLAQCGQLLLTSYGLRSLASGEAGFCPTYCGDVVARDAAYHQGTVWTWLLGHYALAHYRVHGDVARARALLEPIADHLRDAALGSVSEIFDAAPPHKPRGAPAQAWSVACILQAWWQLERLTDGQSSHGPFRRSSQTSPG
jgi:4-alpha-glucanotransferase